MKPNKDLTDLLAFIDLTHKFQSIKRVVFKRASRYLENDAEHSYQLALVSWYISDVHKLKLNKEKLLMYAIAHDLVEIYAGDVYFYNTKARAKKEENERKAFEKIKADFPRFTALHNTIHSYEAKKDKESKFVWALDKLLPMLNIYLDGGRNWKKKGLTLSTIHKFKRGMIAQSEAIEKYYKLLYKTLKKETGLFPK